MAAAATAGAGCRREGALFRCLPQGAGSPRLRIQRPASL